MGEDCQLEICVDSTEGALAAARGGADRIELCADLAVGGTTPDPQLFLRIRELTDIRVHVMIRPRSGDFCYTDEEFEIMLREVRQFRDLGAEGMVSGILLPDGALDTERMKKLCDAAGGMSKTLHRAFDLAADPEKTLEDAADLGMDIILTSGTAESAVKGIPVLSRLERQAKGRILVMAGAGVNAGNMEEIYDRTGIRAFHMSAGSTVPSPMRFRRQEVKMGLPGFSEYERQVTDEEKVRAAERALERIREAAGK